MIPSVPVTFFLHAWSAWAPGYVSFEQWLAWNGDLSKLDGEERAPAGLAPPLVRRRLSDVGRVAFQVASSCVSAEQLGNVETVFSSRNGEAETTLRLLTGLVREEDLSPNDFSLSVHNSTAGLFSIVTSNHKSATALAARKYTFAAGLVEAVLRLNGESVEPVMLVHADETIPPPFRTDIEDVHPLHGLALLISRQPSQDTTLPWHLEFLASACDEPDLPQPLRFVRWLTEQSSEACFALGRGTIRISKGGPVGELFRGG